MEQRNAITARGLAKSYGEVGVLRGIDLTVAEGSVFALLGPNGAGKTTTVKILATLVEPDAGEATVAGFDLARERARVRAAISLTGQYAALDELQTGAENLRMMGALAGLPRPAARARAEELLARFELTEAGGRRVVTYSGGMRRRIDLAASLVAEPAVIFLDEPTTGLDPRSRGAMWEVIVELVAAGTTVFLTTQYLEEADHLADRIAVLDAGRVVAEGTPAELKRRVAGPRLKLRCADATSFGTVLDRLGDDLLDHDLEGLRIDIATGGSAAEVRCLLDRVDPDVALVSSFALTDPSLDDVFLALTGHGTGAETQTTDLKETANV